MKMDKLVSLCKRRGIIFQSSEIYGGLNGFWDYGPLGVELKRNIKEAWWLDMVVRHNELKAPEGAPNVLLILLDDVGFGQFSTFGGGVPSPTMDRLAKEGLRYNRSDHV